MSVLVAGCLMIMFAACGPQSTVTQSSGKGDGYENGYVIYVPYVGADRPLKPADRYEPEDGKVLYGMGQSLSKYASETKAGIDAVGVGPVLLSGYGSCSRSGFQRLVGEIDQINSDEGRMHILVWGMDCNLDALMSGQQDAELRALGEMIKADGRPVFIRPFYEINGGAWNQIIKDWCAAQNPVCNPAETAKAAFIRVIEQMQLGAMGNSSTRIPNIARVWHGWAYPNLTDDVPYEAYYPGQNYVDWIGGSIFNQLNSAPYTITAFQSLIDFAEKKDRPVMIPESAPVWPNAGPGVCDGPYGIHDPEIVRDFFDPYFEIIRHPRVKAFIYISADWRIMELCTILGWPDTRIEQNLVATQRFAQEVGDNSIYIAWPFGY